MKTATSALSAFLIAATALFSGCDRNDADTPAQDKAAPEPAGKSQIETSAKETASKVQAQTPAKPADKNAPVKKTTDLSPWAKLPETAAVMVVNGVPVTKREIIEHGNLMLELYKNKFGEAKREQIAVMSARFRTGAFSELLNRTILSSVLQPTNKVDTADNRKALERKWRRAFCAKRQTFDALRKKIESKGLGAAFKRSFENDLKVQEALVANYSHELAVTDVDMANARTNMVNYNRIANATNAWVFATASNIVQQLAAGADFAALADKYSQDPDKEPGGVLGELVDTDLDVDWPAQKEIIRAMKIGDVSPLFTTEGGVEILKKTGEISPDKSVTGLPAIKLSRIYLRRVFVFPEQDDEDLRSDLAEEKRDEFMKNLMMRLRKAAKVEYPHGKDVLPKPRKRGKPLPKKPIPAL